MLLFVAVHKGMVTVPGNSIIHYHHKTLQPISLFCLMASCKELNYTVLYLQFLPLTLTNGEMTQTSNNHLSGGMFSTEARNDEDRRITTEEI